MNLQKYIERRLKKLDGFVIFFVGMMVGVILGVFIMAVAVAAGRTRDDETE